ncbi:hypothetical protein QAD02_020189 [Eretmocerus hayati]|uniref:Uncharacterized protein n=1 Tax=Eretmocerus hayati TaxID=131215 RepID=A0ACC2PLY0_9HYME|nr:hypothetical protein QAD02_020189 [Eretmocerus hayati]
MRITEAEYLTLLSKSFENLSNIASGNFENGLHRTIVGTVVASGQHTYLKYGILPTIILEVVTDAFRVPVVIFGEDMKRLSPFIANGNVVQITSFFVARMARLRFGFYIVFVDSTVLIPLEVLTPHEPIVGTVVPSGQHTYLKYRILHTIILEVVTDAFRVPDVIFGEDMKRLSPFIANGNVVQITSSFIARMARLRFVFYIVFVY